MHDQNPWWRGDAVPPSLSKRFPRRDFFVLRDLLDDPGVTVVYGPRQVGKTTLLYQLIQHLVQEKQVEPKRVLFFSFDYLAPVVGSGTSVADLVDLYGEAVLGRPISRDGEKVYVFLDEVAREDGWSRSVKGLVDQRLGLKMVLSDSTQSLLQTGLARDLVGRHDARLVLPLKFIDFFAFRRKDTDLSRSMLAHRDRVAAALRGGSPAKTLQAFRGAQRALAPLQRSLAAELNRYLLIDGFPALVETTDYRDAARVLRRYVELTLYKDVVRIFEVRNPATLEALAALVADHSSDRMSNQSLARTLKIREETLGDYLRYLRSVFMVAESEFYTKSRSKRIRRPRKLYLRDCGLRNAIAGSLDRTSLADATLMGRITETAIADHSMRLAFHLNGSSSLRYWQDKNGHEVDIVIEAGKRPIGIESKSGRSVAAEDLRGVASFLEEHTGSLALVVTKDRLERKGRVVMVPLPTFLSCC